MLSKFRAGTVLALISIFCPCVVLGQAASRSTGHRNLQPHARLLRRSEGLTIIAAALKLRPRLVGYDCSHLVHVVYERAGFPYRYSTAGQLYFGIGEFRRVMHAQPGDLVVFRDKGKNGHVGIMVSPAQGLFFSGLNHGPGVSSYISPYWRARGYPHFFRYIRTAPLGRHINETARIQ
jgi:cell wall-associated NlpC family hydrolase